MNSINGKYFPLNHLEKKFPLTSSILRNSPNPDRFCALVKVGCCCCRILCSVTAGVEEPVAPGCCVLRLPMATDNQMLPSVLVPVLLDCLLIQMMGFQLITSWSPNTPYTTSEETGSSREKTTFSLPTKYKLI